MKLIRSLQTAFENESIVRRIVSEQTENGVQFDVKRTNRYLAYIERKKLQLYKQIRPMLQLEVIQPYGVPVNKPFLKDGSYSVTAQKWYGDAVDVVWGTFTRVEFREPDLGSRQKLQSQLLRLGWQPRHFTEKGNPKLTVDSQPCQSLLDLDSETGKSIALFYILSHRESQLNGWIKHVRHNGRIPQEVFTIGTPTFRMRHKILVNVPKAAPQVVFGKQMRSVFTVRKGMKLVGHDASGLELRMLAHYMNDPEYIKVVCEGTQAEGTDVHSINMIDAGLPNRDAAKTFIYAFNYGAGDLLIGIAVNNPLEDLVGKFSDDAVEHRFEQLKERAVRINNEYFVDIGKKTFIKITPEMALRALDGAQIKTRFLRANPSLANLIKNAQEAAKRGWLLGLDGRRIQLRRDIRGRVQIHKALNTLLQTAGAVVMKHSIVLLDRYLKEEGLRSKKVIDMHDEGQSECYPEEAKRHGELAVQSIIDAGLLLELNCPLDAEYKIGANWSQTH